MFKKLLFFSLFFGAFVTYGQQKRALTHDDYDLWKKINNTQLSKSGEVIVNNIETTTGRGDGYIEIFNTKTEKYFRFKNGFDAKISGDARYVFFLRKPEYEFTRQEKKKEVKKEDRTKNDLFIFDVANNQITDSILRVKKFEIPEETSGWVLIEKYKNPKPEKEKDSSEVISEKSSVVKNDTIENKVEKLAEKADYALVYQLKNKKVDTLFQIKDFRVPKEGNRFIYSTTKGKKKGDIGIFSYNIEQGSKIAIDTGRYAYNKLAIDRKGEQFAFLAARDSTENDSLKYELFYGKDKELKQLTDTLGKNLRNEWELSSAQSPYFSKNGKRLFFYSRPQRHFNLDTNLLEEEIAQVDVWNYRDKLIQPEQKVKLKDLENKAYQSFYNTDSNKIITLHDKTVEFMLFDEDYEQRYVLGHTSAPYDVARSWDYPHLRDYYIIDTHTGEKSLALEGSSARPYLAPNGKYALFYEQENRSWWSLDLENNTQKNLTNELVVNLFDEENDVPALPSAYGFGGFTPDGKALIYDKYDIWQLTLSGDKKPKNITKTGRKNEITFRSHRLDREHRNEATFYNGGLLITAFNQNNKANSLYSLSLKNGKKLAILETDNFMLSGVDKAENSQTLVFTKQNFQTYPNLYILKTPKAKPVKLTELNQQQKEFNWGSVEQVSWTAYDGTPLDGLLYKPENFDANKKYPLMVYFYEKRSDTYHRYYSPQPSASTVNISYLASNDYVTFVPDIVYTVGQPGQDAYNSIVSGVEAMEAKGFIDSENMALQGQSWGGYQIAYLVTVTNKFKAAMAGAPVSNMTSAYGGIRWKTGLSRAFQYEKTQSRIGKNLWEGLDLYLENSPLFGIPNIETPLLMMHNDEDGAVPYYQGIEMFMGMRRLNKPVWLLVYNNEAHNLTQMKNKQDLSIRMMQFFDHYLKGEPAPLWMTEGLPAVMKGKTLRYELDKG